MWYSRMHGQVFFVYIHMRKGMAAQDLVYSTVATQLSCVIDR